MSVFKNIVNVIVEKAGKEITPYKLTSAFWFVGWISMNVSVAVDLEPRNNRLHFIV